MANRITVATLDQDRNIQRAAVRLCFVMALLVPSIGCHREESPTAAEELDQATSASEIDWSEVEELDHATSDFGVYWPPTDPEEVPPTSVNALLEGTLCLDAIEQTGDSAAVRLVVTVTRPSSEADRLSWNSVLAFDDIAWMSEVRVWDAQRQWLWPNLPYLLRLPGRERVQRYGGVDPGKHVDNDFAAVLIRKYDAAGVVESEETKDAPLVSAEWYADGVADTDLRDIMHVARSDEFLLHLGGEDGPVRGQLKVWLIYADFLGARAPRTWPKAREWAGGILAFFEVDWQASPNHGCRAIVRHTKPRQSTRFDWAEWVVRVPGSNESQAQVRLSDITKQAAP